MGDVGPAWLKGDTTSASQRPALGCRNFATNGTTTDGIAFGPIYSAVAVARPGPVVLQIDIGFEDSRIFCYLFVLTGASECGLGGATALALALARPSHLVLLARTESKVRNVISAIKEISPGTLPAFVHIELDDLDSVRRAATDVLGVISKIDVLINNAGVMAIPWSKSNSGLEKTPAINHLGQFLLTKLLIPSILAAGPGSRIVNITSASASRIY
ncbi:hypothetical protein BDV36DRAFT_302129 [Aspergillus pseudocaelatus]|uniref:NAD(P)-binding protein n=1 Tax=Aspergillus pseudocaelatus TaxID=1825620 RepID=A0ABQ6W6V2_9EURO|nr:hypothetical protein BDV36DRAFT_302129 [Aspergillus pseudocaelatus]